MKTAISLFLILACSLTANAATTTLSGLPVATAISTNDDVIINATNAGAGTWTSKRGTVGTLLTGLTPGLSNAISPSLVKSNAGAAYLSSLYNPLLYDAPLKRTVNTKNSGGTVDGTYTCGTFSPGNLGANYLFMTLSNGPYFSGFRFAGPKDYDAKIWFWPNHGYVTAADDFEDSRNFEAPELLVECAGSIAIIPGTGGKNRALQLGVAAAHSPFVYMQGSTMTAGLNQQQGPYNANLGASMPILFAPNYSPNDGGTSTSARNGGGLGSMAGLQMLARATNGGGLTELVFWDYLDTTLAGNNFTYASSKRRATLAMGDGGGLDLRGKLILERSASTPAGAGIGLDFAGAQWVDLTPPNGAVTFFETNATYAATNYEQRIFILRGGTFGITPTWPQTWTWLTPAPPTITNGTLMRLQLESTGPKAGTNVYASASYGTDPTAAAPDSDAAAFITRASITDAAHKAAVNTLAISAKAHSWWSLCDAIYPMVGGNATAHGANLKSASYTITWAAGGVTHDANGVTFDGAAGYGNTGFTPSTAGGQYTLNSSHFFVYSGTTPLPTLNRVWMGVQAISSCKAAIAQGASSYVNGWQNEDYTTKAEAHISNYGSDPRGPILATRTGASANNVYVRTYTGPTSTGASTTLPGAVVGLGACSLGGSSYNLYAAVNLRGASIGGGISAAVWADMRADWDAFNQALSRKVP